MNPLSQAKWNEPLIERLRQPSERLLQTNEEEIIVLIQSYGKRIHDGMLFRQRVRDDVERMSGLVKALEQLGWFDNE